VQKGEAPNGVGGRGQENTAVYKMRQLPGGHHQPWQWHLGRLPVLHPQDARQRNDTARRTVARALKQAAEALGCSERLLDAIGTLANAISESISGDLKDIWKRLDEIEQRLR